MKFSRCSFLPPVALLAAGLLATAGSLHAAPPSTNAAPQPELIKSVFDVTSSPVKDPFFPHTTRLPIPVAAVTNAPVADTSALVLNGLSGAAGQRLAMINNQTLGEGEWAEIRCRGGVKIRIHLLEIKDSSVIVKTENGAAPVELRYEERPSKR
jgi:hypothetical protein